MHCFIMGCINLNCESLEIHFDGRKRLASYRGWFGEDGDASGFLYGMSLQKRKVLYSKREQIR